MTKSQSNSSVKAPWHLWVVGIAGLLWSVMGVMDYVMTKMRNEEYMAAFTLEQLEFFYGFPIWVNAAWAIAVWGGVIGTILLLLRKSSGALQFNPYVIVLGDGYVTRRGFGADELRQRRYLVTSIQCKKKHLQGNPWRQANLGSLQIIYRMS